jgi:large subunit ribosomal protein L24
VNYVLADTKKSYRLPRKFFNRGLIIMMRIRKNDKVVVISGKDKGTVGTVLAVDARKDKVLVQGVAIVTAHRKARRPGQQSGIQKMERYIPLCKVMPICPDSGKPTRVAVRVLEDGTKVRYSKRHDESF